MPCGAVAVAGGDLIQFKLFPKILLANILLLFFTKLISEPEGREEIYNKESITLHDDEREKEKEIGEMMIKGRKRGEEERNKKGEEKRREITETEGEKGKDRSREIGREGGTEAAGRDGGRNGGGKKLMRKEEGRQGEREGGREREGDIMENEEVPWWLELIMHRSNEKSKNKNSSNS